MGHLAYIKLSLLAIEGDGEELRGGKVLRKGPLLPPAAMIWFPLLSRRSMRCDCGLLGGLTVSYDSLCPRRTSSIHLYSSQAKSWNEPTSAQLTQTMRLYGANGFANVPL